MNDILIVLILVLVINTIISFLVFVFNVKKNKTKALLFAMIILFVPVFSELYFIMIELIKLVMKLFRLDTVDISDLAARSKIKVIEGANLEVERNKVPLEESLIISDRVDRRNAFLEILKSNSADSIQSIHQAVENEDSEISHYAAAFLSEEVAKFKRKEKEIADVCEARSDIVSLYEYAEYVGGFLSKNVMMIEEEKRFAKFLNNKLWKIVDMSDKPLEGSYVALVIKVLQIVGDEENTKKWIEYALKYAHNDLDNAKVCLKYMFSKGKYQEFKNLMEEIKSSPMLLDNETVEWIRFFSNIKGTPA